MSSRYRSVHQSTARAQLATKSRERGRIIDPTPHCCMTFSGVRRRHAKLPWGGGSFQLVLQSTRTTFSAQTVFCGLCFTSSSCYNNTATMIHVLLKNVPNPLRLLRSPSPRPRPTSSRGSRGPFSLSISVSCECRSLNPA